MPITDRLSASICTTSGTGISGQMTQAGVPKIGHYKSISALNSSGIFVPGLFRANPVKIWNSLGISNPANYTPKQTYLGNTRVLAGDIAAYASDYGGPFDSWKGTMTARLDWDSQLAQYSLLKAYEKACEPDFDVGILIGELHETLAGIANPLSALRKYINKFNSLYTLKRTGREIVKINGKSRPSMSDTLDMLSGSWLEWRYGITPLIITIESAIKHFKEKSLLLDGKMFRAKGRAKGPVIHTGYSATTTVGNMGSASFSVRSNGLLTRKVVTTSKLYYQLDAPITFAERYGFDILSTPGIAWELVKLSFVVDWFLSVSLWLDSIRYGLSTRKTLGSVTSQRTSIEYKVLSCEARLGTNPWYNTGSGFAVTVECLERRVNQAVPLLPAVNPVPLSLKRQVDALTLTWQRLPKFRRS